MKTLNLVLRGTSPLICNNTPPEGDHGNGTPADLARERLWRDAKGNAAIPAAVIHRALQAGWECLNLPLETYPASLVEFDAIEYRLYRNIDDASLATFGIETRVKTEENYNGDDKQTTRYRPRFDRWEVAIGLRLTDQDGLEAAVLAAFHHAGRHIGIGYGRPINGRFVVEVSKMDAVSRAAWDRAAARMAAEINAKAAGEGDHGCDDAFVKAAKRLAKQAHNKEFATRVGVWQIDEHRLCVFNNNPWADDAGRRDRETAAFRDWLNSAGITELGYATYPPAGDPDAGYTYAMLLAAGEDRKGDVMDALDRIREDIHKESLAQS
ncbi:MAG TPA: hypothetical protein VGE52_21950 [Pirellulales bacterium]